MQRPVRAHYTITALADVAERALPEQRAESIDFEGLRALFPECRFVCLLRSLE